MVKRLIVLSTVILSLVITNTTQAVDKKIYSIADGENDPYKRNPNGDSYVMWTDYTATSASYRRRAVIKFDTSSVSDYALRGAVLNAWGTSGNASATSVGVYYYSYDGWSESSIPYASSLGSKLGSVSVAKASDISVAPQYEISLTNMPYISPSDNYLSLALVANSGYGAYFVTRNGVNWNGTATKKPYLTFRTWGDTSLDNSDFDGGFDSWDIISGGGTAQIVGNPIGEGSVVELTAGSPVGISQILDTPQEAFYINFDYMFQTASGALDITLIDRDGVDFLVGSLEAGDLSEGQMKHAALYVSDASWLYLDNVTLKLQLDGVAGSQILLDNIEFSNIPEPSTLLLLGLGGMLLKSRRKKKV